MVIPKTEVIITVEGAERDRFVVRPGEFVIGRNPDCQIRIDAPLVSRAHAKLTLNFDNAFIEDLGSSNGTQVNGTPVTGNTRLWPNQKIQVGVATIEMRRLKVESSPDMTLAPAQEVMKRMLPGEFLREKKYDIGGVVAKGGMGAILDAREAAIKRKVAMKVMLDGHDPDNLARFIAEAQVTGQLEHPNIVPVHELNVDENGQPFYTMKMVRGITLRKVLELLAEGVAATVKKYPLPALLTVFQKVCDALAFAHSKGVIHRDLKPENIMLGDYGEVLVMDWGLAKVLAPTRAAASAAPDQELRSMVHTASADGQAGSMTLAGSVMGTPYFMSPEQARGEVETLDARSDIYALGAILYQTLTLRLPVEGKDVHEVLAKVGRGEIEPLQVLAPRRKDAKEDKDDDAQSSNFASLRLCASHLPGGRIPESLAAVVRKAMALDREARYRSVPELQQEIEAFQNGFATSAENAGAWKQLTLLVKRNKAASIGVAAVLLVGGVLGTKAILEGKRAERGEALAKSEAVRARNEAVRAERGEAKANAALADLKASAPSLFALAESEAGLQRFDSALEKLNAALALDADLPAAYWRRAWILLAQEKFAESAAAVRTAQTRDPANAARLGAILPVLDEIQSATPAERWNPVRAGAVLAHLQTAGASGEAIALSSRFQLSSADKLKMVNERVKAWLGKGFATIATDGSIVFGALPKAIDTIEPLRGLPINSLVLDSTAVKNLEPLRGMPLHTLSLSQCKGLTDLSPLRGMRLRKLDINTTPVADLSPLAGMPLTELHAGGTSVEDLTPLEGMPLKMLMLGQTKVRGLSPLKGMPLEKLVIAGTSVGDLTPLKGMPLRELDAGGLQGGSVDVSPLRGMPLKILKLTAVDFSPLAGMELDYLDVGSQANLAALRGIRATKLRIIASGSSSKNIEPLKDVGFKSLTLAAASFIRDVSPLRDCREMEELTLLESPAPLDPLRGHPTLKFIAWSRPGAIPIPLMPVEKFWPAYDAQQAAQKK